ncbi:F-box protein At1g10780-like isoform X2 [Zingiber officinale]|uniref:F-box protein At1g10780-like isoform X2 n=1 Tax=Zingiber officinale TaxID=94328 RepID=UPI001C4B5135|nr:F-box protein At1g10780-like isoform X2 [Zingiber officinale]
MSLETMTRKKGRRFPGERTTMESLPDDMLRRILSRLCDARDVAACSPVSRRWREATAFIPSLHFLSNALQGGGTPADADILRMVSAAASSLEDLVIHCPFSGRSLASCLALCGQSLRSLDLRVDLLDGGLDCVSLAKGLESLKLWHPSLISSPNWGLSAYGRLRRLEMVGGMVLSEHLADVMRACPHLTDLILIRCCSEGAISIELERLERCKLDLYLTVHCSLNLNSPRLQDLDIQGFFRIQVGHNHRLKRLSIANNEGNVTMVDVGKLPELEYLSIEGQHWYWSEIRTLLRNAIERFNWKNSSATTGNYVSWRSTVRSSQHFSMVLVQKIWS